MLFALIGSALTPQNSTYLALHLFGLNILVPSTRGKMKNKRLISSAFLVIIFLYSITGCASSTRPDDESIYKNFAICLEDGTTTKEEVLQLNLYPLYKSKNDRIWLFAIPYLGQKGGYGYDLVLIFNEDGVLKKHSLVK
jgi:hypothetical protein